MTLKMKFIQFPQLDFFEKKSSRFIIVIIYIYIIYLIGLNLCPTLCLILCPIFPIPKDIIHLTYRVMSSLNTLDLCLILCRTLCLILCPSRDQREFQNRYLTTQTVKYQPITYILYEICNIMNNISVFKNAEHQGYILIAYCETSFYRYNYPFKLLILAQTLCTWSMPYSIECESIPIQENSVCIF